jgi:hypothetical protein
MSTRTVSPTSPQLVHDWKQLWQPHRAAQLHKQGQMVSRGLLAHHTDDLSAQGPHLKKLCDPADKSRALSSDAAAKKAWPACQTLGRRITGMSVLHGQQLH